MLDKRHLWLLRYSPLSLRTHTSGEELDRFSGYSEEPEPYHPPMPLHHHPLQQAGGQEAPQPGQQQQQQRRRRHPAQHQPNPRWDRIPPAGYAEGDPEKAAPR